MEKSANELFGMLKTTEAGMQKNKEVLMVKKLPVSKRRASLRRNLLVPVRSYIRRRTRAEPLKRLNVSTANRRVAGSITARNIWQTRRMVLPVKV